MPVEQRVELRRHAGTSACRRRDAGRRAQVARAPRRSRYMRVLGQQRLARRARRSRGCASRACCSRRRCTARGRTACARRWRRPGRRPAAASSAAPRRRSHSRLGRRGFPVGHRRVARVARARRRRTWRSSAPAASRVHPNISRWTSTKRRTLSSGVFCRMPWPRPQTQARARPGRQRAARSRTRRARATPARQPAAAATPGSTLPWRHQRGDCAAQRGGEVVAPVDAEALQIEASSARQCAGPVPRE